jgi:hypothetical protein
MKIVRYLLDYIDPSDSEQAKQYIIGISSAGSEHSDCIGSGRGFEPPDGIGTSSFRLHRNKQSYLT